MIQRKGVSLYFRIFAFLFVLAGLLTHLGALSGSIRPSQLMYYTIQSNILAVFLFLILLHSSLKVRMAVSEEGQAALLTRFEMICVVDLLLTCVVYWTMLAPPDFSKPNGGALWKFDNLAVHLFTPMLCLLDYILYAERKQLQYRDVYAVLLFPLAYVVYSSAAGFAGYTYAVSSDGTPRHFPYFFLNYDQLGARAILYIGLLTAMLLAMSHIIYFFDKRAGKSEDLAPAERK
jgi:hypothetical protein